MLFSLLFPMKRGEIGYRKYPKFNLSKKVLYGEY